MPRIDELLGVTTLAAAGMLFVIALQPIASANHLRDAGTPLAAPIACPPPVAAFAQPNIAPATHSGV